MKNNKLVLKKVTILKELLRITDIMQYGLSQLASKKDSKYIKKLKMKKEN
jgi:hypothetical protein